jgi:hypothetical protein
MSKTRAVKRPVLAGAIRAAIKALVETHETGEKGMRDIGRRLARAEKKLRPPGESSRIDYVFISPEEGYALNLEILEQYEAHPEKFTQEKIQEVRESKKFTEEIVEGGTGIAGATAEEEERHRQEFYDEVEAVRRVIRKGGLESFRPIGEDAHCYKAESYPGYEKLYYGRKTRLRATL